MLTGIAIEDFRTFDSLELDGFGQVNLIVGQNNAGKTCLLEAILTAVAPQVHLPKLAGAFRAADDIGAARFFRWLIREGAPRAFIRLLATPSPWTVIIGRDETQPPKSDQDRSTTTGNPAQFLRSFGADGLNAFSTYNDVSNGAPPPEARSIPVQGGNARLTVQEFASAVRTSAGEKKMEALLRSLDSRVQAVRLDLSDGREFVAVDIGLKERIPLAQVGEGLTRLVAIFSALLGPRTPNVCLIDEIENGIYYEALPKVWSGIAEASEQLKVQVFATTHSRECLQAAHEAFAEREDYGLRVIQFARVDGSVKGRVLDRRLIEAAIAGDIELR